MVVLRILTILLLLVLRCVRVLRVGAAWMLIGTGNRKGRSRRPMATRHYRSAPSRVEIYVGFTRRRERAREKINWGCLGRTLGLLFCKRREKNKIKGTTKPD